jgi:hypothetical protein
MATADLQTESPMAMSKSLTATEPCPEEDGALRENSAWDKQELLCGWKNSVELAAEEVTCPALPIDLKGTYYRNNCARVVNWGGVPVRHPFDADGMVCMAMMLCHAPFAPQSLPGHPSHSHATAVPFWLQVCAVTLDGSRGTAVVRQRYVVTSGTAAEKEANKALYPGVFGGAVPAWEAPIPKNVANTGVCWHGVSDHVPVRVFMSVCKFPES